jgi:ABC-type Fe3+/spermidine/putrescine transport system ATPase subunit
MATLRIQELTKEFPGTTAVRGVDLTIASGEFFSILGPSGCGKTTLLRMIAGFERPTGGNIAIDERDITSVPPHKRGIGMVFQNYALFPHLNVFENVAYGLRARHERQEAIARAVDEALTAVDLLRKKNVPVPELSGGEQQRVAVARAIVIKPSILLFDEPLSNLDVALRVRTREEIRRLQRDTGITTVYVTHDQSEAMSLADRIGVMRQGALEQVGTPAALYESPRSPFVAVFLGDANLLTATLEGTVVSVPELDLRAPVPVGYGESGVHTIAIKPEAITLSKDGGGTRAAIVEREFLGFTTQFRVRVGTVTLRVAVLSSAATRDLATGDIVGLQIDWTRCPIFPEGER